MKNKLQYFSFIIFLFKIVCIFIDFVQNINQFYITIVVHLFTNHFLLLTQIHLNSQLSKSLKLFLFYSSILIVPKTKMVIYELFIKFNLVYCLMEFINDFNHLLILIIINQNSCWSSSRISSLSCHAFFNYIVNWMDLI